jgi:hypothetical protein
MPVPTHRASCQTVIYPTNCWDCASPIHVLQCTCGSAVLLDKPAPPWPEHDCGSGGIGGSGLKGWEAVDVLRANGVTISADILDKIFPVAERSSKNPKSPPPESIIAVQPIAGANLTFLAVVRELLTDTKRTAELNSLGAVGARILRLPKGDLWQITLVVNNERPNKTYTCILPAGLGVARDAKNKIVFAQLEARIAGAHAHWLVTDIRLL